jgi:hypothetical protein
MHPCSKEGDFGYERGVFDGYVGMWGMFFLGLWKKMVLEWDVFILAG